MTCLMLPRAEFSWQPVAAAAEPLASTRAPAPCAAMNVTIAAAAIAARIARFPTCSPPLLVVARLPHAEPRRRPTRSGRRSGDAEVRRCLQAARSRGAKEAPGFGLREPHAVVHQLERRLR